MTDIAEDKDQAHIEAMSTSKTHKVVPADYSLNTQEAVKEFAEASERFTKRVTASPETARAMLVEMGIYTKNGKLTKNYSR